MALESENTHQNKCKYRQLLFFSHLISKCSKKSRKNTQPYYTTLCSITSIYLLVKLKLGQKRARDTG